MPNQPDTTFRDGSLKATVWKNEGEKGEYFSTKLSRSYQDQEGQWQETSSLRDGDLLRSGNLLSRAHEHVCERKQERSPEREEAGADRKASFAEQRSASQQSRESNRAR